MMHKAPTFTTPPEVRPCVRGGCLRPRVPAVDGPGQLCDFHLELAEERQTSWEIADLLGRVPEMPLSGPVVFKLDDGEWYIDCQRCSMTEPLDSHEHALQVRRDHVCSARKVRSAKIRMQHRMYKLVEKAEKEREALYARESEEDDDDTD